MELELVLAKQRGTESVEGWAGVEGMRQEGFQHGTVDFGNREKLGERFRFRFRVGGSRCKMACMDLDLDVVHGQPCTPAQGDGQRAGTTHESYCCAYLADIFAWPWTVTCKSSSIAGNRNRYSSQRNSLHIASEFCIRFACTGAGVHAIRRAGVLQAGLSEGLGLAR